MATAQPMPAEPRRRKRKDGAYNDGDMEDDDSEEDQQFCNFDEGNAAKQQFAILKAMLAAQNTQKKRLAKMESDVQRIDKRGAKNEADFASMQQQIRSLQLQGPPSDAGSGDAW
eukprot:6840706-Pyramimonas_sp.AAC.1